jgi:glutamyl-tRNA synthetase
MSVISRFAPSPTGKLHFGSTRAALFPYLFTRKYNGKFILRIDNTDNRSTDLFTEDIFKNLKWLNIDYDLTFEQRSRLSIYEDFFQILKDNNYVYECFETENDLEQIRLEKRLAKKAPIFRENDKRATPGTGNGYWRFRLNHETYVLKDRIFGELKFKRDWSDPVIKKGDGTFTYLLTSVIDDILTEVTDVIRGSDHLTNAVVQKDMGDVLQLILKNTSWNINYAHFPMFLNEQGNKLSKRNADSDLSELLDLEPWSLWSVVTYLGNSQKQIFSTNKEDYIRNFNIENYSKAPVKFNYDLLLKTNVKILRGLSEVKGVENKKAWDLFKNNIDSVEDFNNLISHLQKWKKSSEFDNYILKKDAIAIYEECLGRNRGPQINDLLNYLKEEKMI